MALFKKNSKKETQSKSEVKESKKEVVAKAEKGTSSVPVIIKAPRITEKAAYISSDNAYTFDVAVDSNKIQIKKAIEVTYKVKPKKVNIINRKAHKETKRGRKVHASQTKKAIVFLKKGDSIELA